MNDARSIYDYDVLIGQDKREHVLLRKTMVRCEGNGRGSLGLRASDLRASRFKQQDTTPETKTSGSTVKA